MKSYLGWLERPRKSMFFQPLIIVICTVSFDLWMSRMEVDTFVMIVHFLND
jgi:hypothetical protein